MLPPLDYLAWAQRHYGALRLDLATSGLPALDPQSLGPAPSPADLGAWTGYRAAVAARYRTTEAEVTPALGTSGALWLVYAGMLDRGDEIVIEDPTYEPVVRVAEGAGLSIRRFPRRREDGWALDPALVLAALSPRTRAVVLTDLHNPSGVAVDHAVLRELAGELGRRAVLLFVDEVYAELVAPGRTARALGANVITASSLTKCFGLGWARAGFVLSSPELAERGARATLHVAGMLPASIAGYGVRAFERLDALERRRVELQGSKRARVDAWLADHAARLSWVAPHAGSLFGFVRDARGDDTRERLEAGLAKSGVLAVPGVFFGDAASFRLGWTCPETKLDEALARLADALEL